MTIYYKPDSPTDPDTIDVWHVQDDGTQTEIGPVDVSGVSGMPDSLGGIAPDAVRGQVATYFFEEATPGNSPSLNQASAQVIRDALKHDYVRGTPP